LSREYVVAVYLEDLTPTAKNATVHLTIDANTCGNQHWDGNNCVAATPIDTKTSLPVHFTAGQSQFFSFAAPAFLGSFNLTVRSIAESAVEEITTWVRYESTPLPDHHDGKGTDSVAFTSPRPGQWILRVASSVAAHLNLTLTAEQCSKVSAGLGCLTPIAKGTDNMTLTLVSGKPQYFYYDVDPLWVSVTAENVSLVPHIYASLGQLPQKDNADISNCNQDACNVVSSIKHKHLVAGEVWIVSVVARETVTAGSNSTYGIWWNQTCVPNCEQANRGECQPTGQCSCELDFEGIDCSIPKGLGPQYIVLIIIASLVVASAIIGFVAWAYMRRKRRTYEQYS
jgi:hypothetical protein